MPDFRAIPSIEQMRQTDAIRGLERRYGHAALVQALREEAAAVRERLASAQTTAGALEPGDTLALIARGAEARLRRAFRQSLRSVINATGVIIHTNLGRAPLAPEAVRAVAELSSGYTNLEYDLEQGRRGTRDRHAETLLCRLTGADAAVIVNNNAAATLIALAALASGREVVISRGELVEIGGGFRIPDVMAQSRAVLREVGTTNKTRASDYAAAVSDRTALILRVHPSNFRMEGFTERPTLEELVALGRDLRVPVAEDLGSGNLIDAPATGSAEAFAGEPTVQASVAAGADIVCFSGDKMLGGPQCGVIVGRADPVGRIRRHPLMRALRVDKMTYAALEATLVEYASGRALETIPVARMIGLSADAIGQRASQVLQTLTAVTTSRHLQVDIVDGVSTIGGGSAPGAAIPTRLLALASRTEAADALESRLRTLDPPIIGRIERDRVMLDLRTVLPEQDGILRDLLISLFRDEDNGRSRP